MGKASIPDNYIDIPRTLVEKKLLQGKIIPWIDAFVSIANQSSHKDFPSPKEMEDSNLRRRVMLTFETGLQILEELNAIIYPPISFSKIPKIKIRKEKV